MQWELHFNRAVAHCMTEGESGSSFVRRWQLAAALKDFREKAGLTQGQAVAELRRLGGRWSESKL